MCLSRGNKWKLLGKRNAWFFDEELEILEQVSRDWQIVNEDLRFDIREYELENGEGDRLDQQNREKNARKTWEL